MFPLVTLQKCKVVLQFKASWCLHYWLMTQFDCASTCNTSLAAESMLLALKRHPIISQLQQVIQTFGVLSLIWVVNFSEKKYIKITLVLNVFNFLKKYYLLIILVFS